MQGSPHQSDIQRPRVILADTSFNHKLPTPREMANYDAATIGSGVPAEALMERAGQAIYAAIAPRLRAKRKPVLVLCGPGNNGGDGLVIARLAALDGLDVTVALIAAPRDDSLSAEMLARLPKNRVRLLKLYQETALEVLVPYFAAGNIVIDALLGTGQSAAPRASIAEILALCQRNHNSLEDRIAVDIPSGLNAASGEVYSPCFSAAITVTVELVKRGMLQYPARAKCGDIIAVSAEINCAAAACEYSMITSDVLSLLPARAADSHKGAAGSVLVVAGSKMMPGAAALSARAALRAGAGRVYRMIHSSWGVDALTPEVMYRSAGGDAQTFTSHDLETTLEVSQGCSALVIGPGITTQRSAAKFAIALLSRLKIAAVVDADALNSLAEIKTQRGWPALKRCIITPHPGEAARLLDCSVAEINRDRYKAAAKLSQLSSAVVVLKGAGTIVYAEKQGWVCDRGTPFLGTAGSGDVLAGLLAALLALGLEPVHAALIGVYSHACAGELAVESCRGPIIASDIIERIPTLLGARVSWGV